MTDRQKIIQDLIANHPSVPPIMSLTSVLNALEAAGYEVKPKAQTAIMPTDMPVTLMGRAEVKALCDQAKRDGAALALRTIAECLDVFRGTQLLAAADKIERGKGVT